MKLDLPDKVFGIETQLLVVFGLPAALALGWIISIMAVVVPKISEVNDLNAQIAKLTQSRKDLETKRAYLTSINQEEIAKNSEALNMALLKNKDAYVLVNVLRALSSSYGFDIDSFSISPGEVGKTEDTSVNSATTKTKANNLVKIPVEIEVVGPKDKFMDLIAGIEKALPILSIDKLENKSDSQLSQVQMTVSSYFSTDQTNVKTNALTLNDLTLTQNESDLVKTISGFNKLQGVNVDDSGLTQDKEFTKYERENPFTL